MSNTLCDLCAQIPHPSIRRLTERVLEECPEAFWQAPASTSGKYHPVECRKPGGLVQHTRAVFIIARALLSAYGWDETHNKYSIVLSAALLHDCYKVAEPGSHSCFEHPMYAAAAVSDMLPQFHNIPGPVGAELVHCIESHMGRWNTTKRGSSLVLPLPATDSALILHHADLIASRPQVHVDATPED